MGPPARGLHLLTYTKEGKTLIDIVCLHIWLNVFLFVCFESVKIWILATILGIIYSKKPFTCINLCVGDNR